MDNKEKDTEKITEKSEKSDNTEKKTDKPKNGKKPAQSKGGAHSDKKSEKNGSHAEKKPAHAEKKPAHAETAKSEKTAEKAPETEAPKKKKKRFTKKREFAICALSIALAFTVCFFVPADTFIANQNDFLVSAPRILLPLLGAALVGSAALILLLNGR